MWFRWPPICRNSARRRRPKNLPACSVLAWGPAMDPDTMFDPLHPGEVVQPEDADPVAEEGKFQPIMPLPGLEKEKIHHPKLGKPSHIWPYHNAVGQLEGYVCRFEGVRPDGSPGKEFRPFRYGELRKNGQTRVGWHWKGWEKG